MSHVDERLLAAKARLDRLDWWPRPVRIDGVRILTAPLVFRLPWLARFDGYALHGVILLRSRDATTDLVTHELCHVWQMQHRPIADAAQLPAHGLCRKWVRAAGARRCRDRPARVGGNEHGGVT